MLHFIDVSNWQHDIDINSLTSIDGVICKATEGTEYVSPYCDKQYQAAKGKGLLRGFYHFAGNKSAIAEANFFLENCAGYFGDGVPILDWEGNQSVAWVNEFVNLIHSMKGVWPIIYANPWRFNQGGVEENCGRWVAEYPAYTNPTFAQAEKWDCPEALGLVCGWQFCSDGKVSGYSGDLDCSLFYMSKSAWESYAGKTVNETVEENKDVEVIETDKHKITIEEK